MRRKRKKVGFFKKSLDALGILDLEFWKEREHAKRIIERKKLPKRSFTKQEWKSMGDYCCDVGMYVPGGLSPKSRYLKRERKAIFDYVSFIRELDKNMDSGMPIGPNELNNVVVHAKKRLKKAFKK